MCCMGGQEKYIHGLLGHSEGKRLLGMESIGIVEVHELD